MAACSKAGASDKYDAPTSPPGVRSLVLDSRGRDSPSCDQRKGVIQSAFVRLVLTCNLVLSELFSEG